MYNLGLTSVGGYITRHTVIEAHTYSYQHVTLVSVDIRTQIAVHAQHAFVQRMVRRQGREPQQGTPCRQASLLDKGAQLCLRIAQLYPLPYQYQRSLGSIDEVSSLLNSFHVHVGDGLITADVVDHCWHIVHLVHLRILGKVKYYGTRSSATCYVEGACYCPRYIFSSTNLITPLGNGLRNTHQVNLLKSICTQEASTHLTGYYHQWRTVYHGIGNACYGIGGTRSACHQAYAHLTRHTGKALCGVGGSLLMANQDVIQRLPVVV